MDYVENLLQSIDQVVYHRLRDQKFDETIICTVTDTSKASRGLYVVSDGTIKFDAYSELTDYKVDEAVRVNIPKGDYSQKKYIIGRSVSEKNGNQPIVYNSPSAEILDISGNLCTNTKAKIIANGGVKEVLIWSNERLSEDYANSIYDSILISAQFQTFFSPYNVSKGTYGLRLKVIIAPKKASDKIICREYDLDSRDMFGDPYNYLLPSLQEVKFNFDVNENIQQMSLYLYQNDDFIYKNDAGTEQRLGMALAENIHVSNVHIGLGTNLLAIEDNSVKIYTDDDLTYNSANGANQKAIKLIWYNKDDKNRYIGFSDGVVDNTYDEMDYDKKTSNHNRLMLQASQGNVPNDYSGFELGARMNEIGNINTSLKKLIDKDLYSNIKKFKNDLAPVNNSNINTSFQTIINYMENEGQAILTQLDSLYNFYLQGLNFAAAASQKKLYYQSSDEKYYIIKDLLDETQRDEIEKVAGLSSQHEEPLFGTLSDDNWNNINDGSLGDLLLTIANNLSDINNEVKTYAANYLGVFNNWQKKIQDILDKIKINTLNLQKISVGKFYPMYPLDQNIDTKGEPSKNYYSRDLFEAENSENDNKYNKGLLKRITTPTSESGFCGFDSQMYPDTINTDDDNKYQIYWYYERNGYTPGEGENPYGGPGWCEIGDSGIVNNISRFTILNTEIQNNEEVIVKNIGLPKPTEAKPNKYPTKPDENDENGYLSISFSSNRPDIKEEKIKCVIIYNHEKYESNILTFKNEDPVAGPELTNAIQLIHGKNSRDIYSCYNADNTLTNASDKVTPRELKIEYLNERGEPETGEDSTLIGSTVYWYVPTGVTMLTVDNGDLGIGDDSVEDFECGSAVDRTYQILRLVKSVKCNNTIQMFKSGGYWKRAGDASAHQYPWLVFNDTGTQVTFYIRSDSGVEEITQNISSSIFYYGDDSYEVVFNSPLLQYTTSRALQKGDGDTYYYTYQGVDYAKTESPSNNCIPEEGLNNIINLTFQYTIEDLVYGGITYKFSDDNKQIVSSNGKKYIIRNNQVTLPVDEPDQYDREGFAYYYKTINSIDDLTFKYRIKEHYSQSFVNNTILCKVVKNNRVLEDSKMFTFSSQGVNGTNYSLAINAEDGVHAFFNGKYNFSISLFDYDGNQIPFTTQPEVKFYNGTIINLQEVLSNENGVLVYRGTVELINPDDNNPNHLIVTTTQPWPINSNDVSDSADNAPVKRTNTITLKKIQPIAYAKNTTYIAEVPTEIIYNSSGSDPSYYKEPLRLYEKQSNGDLQLVSDGYWTIVNNTNNSYLPVLEGQTLNNSELKKYKNGLASLKPLNMYITTQEGFDFCILQYQSNDNTVVLWSQPIVIIQNRFPSTLLNNWDESLQINTEDGTILSNLIGAGRKNNDNSFSGVLMGDVGGEVDDIDSHRGFGLYGFHEGAQSFGFNVDGTAFLGKSGTGRIIFNGDSGQIKSGNYEQNKSGMAIDLDDGHIDAYNFKLSSGNIQLNSSPNKSENYFLIGKDDKNSPCLKYDYNGNLTLRVNELEITGTTENPNLLNNSGPWFYQIQGDSGPDYVTQNWFIAENSENPTYDRGTGSIYIEQNTSLQQNITCDASSYTLSGKIFCGAQVTIGVNLSDKNQTTTYTYNDPDRWHDFCIKFQNRNPITNIKIRPTQTVWVKELKLEAGLNEYPTWTASRADNEQQKADQYINQEYVFNKLTHNGRNQGIYLGDYDNDGNRELFINATLIKAGALTVVNSANDEILKVDIDGSSVKIGGWTAGANYLYTAGNSFGGNNFIGLYTSNASGKVAGQTRNDWRIVAGSKFGVTSDGNLYATNVNLTGTINATGGTIGLISILNGSLYTDSWALGSGGGNIAGWNIETTRLYNGTAGNSDYLGLYTANQSPFTVANQYKSDWRIVAGSNFGVTSDGSLYATNVHLTGIINAQEGGSIGAWAIGEKSIIGSSNDTFINANGTFGFSPRTDVLCGVFQAGAFGYDSLSLVNMCFVMQDSGGANALVLSRKKLQKIFDKCGISHSGIE